MESSTVDQVLGDVPVRSVGTAKVDPDRFKVRLDGSDGSFTSCRQEHDIFDIFVLSKASRGSKVSSRLKHSKQLQTVHVDCFWHGKSRLRAIDR